MAYPVAKSFAAASGQTIRAPARAVPWTKPAPGTFAEFGLNTVNDVRPAGWPSGDGSGPFATWGGAALLPDFGALGGIAWHDSGHPVNVTDPQWAGILMLDLSTRLISLRNKPPVVLDGDNAKYNTYGESTQTATLGHTKPPHTYGGLVNRPAAYGGGPQGSMLRVGFASGESYYGTPTHQFDVSSTTAPAVRKVDAMGGNAYPMPAYDSIRHGFWFLSNNGNGPLQFYAYNVDGTIAAPVSYPGVQFNTYGDGNMVHCPERDCLVAIMRMAGDASQVGLFICPITANTPQGFTQVTPSGSSPVDARCGGSWCAPLGAIICYQGNGSTTVHKLTPPTGSLIGTGWAWSSETMTGVGGISPSSNGSNNGSWGRFIYSPALGCCIWNDSVTTKPQAFTLTGM